MISLFHKNCSDKLKATLLIIDIAPPMNKVIAKLIKSTQASTKQNRGRLPKNKVNKQAKN